MTPRRDREAGITLVEMLVALMIFALVGVASFTTLDTILRVRERSDGRLEQLARMDRALQVFGRDVVQSDPMDVTLADNVLTVRRMGAEGVQRYLLEDQSLSRTLVPKAAENAFSQTLIEEVSDVRFRVLDLEREWRDSWPGATQSGAVAVDMVVTLASGQSLKRLVTLPQPVPR